MEKEEKRSILDHTRPPPFIVGFSGCKLGRVTFKNLALASPTCKACFCTGNLQALFYQHPQKQNFFLDSAAVVIGPPRYVLHCCKQRRSFFYLIFKKEVTQTRY